MEDLTIRSPGVSRRHLVAGAVGAMALPIASSAFGRGIEAPATEADERFMRIALEEAALGDYPFGAVIARAGEVLPVAAISESRSTTRPPMARWSRSEDSSPSTALRS